ncbi:MAG: 6-phospho-beta-glucosidase [Oscillospiraceae bacterium]|nr:6-phospho-beta-glucosidase [Oscillospiraceae bacterium]
MQNNLKAAVIGAGSTYTPELIEGFIEFRDSLPFDNITLMDIDPRRLEITGGLAKRQLAAGGFGGEIVLTTDLDAALDGANFIFGQIRVGQMPARVLDEKIPLKYGVIGQETTGAGGFMKALRTVPVMLDIAGRIKRRSESGAWLINFSNPSGIIAEAVLNHADINMVGLCNAPVNMLRDLAEKAGSPVTDYEYLGLNHLSWVHSETAPFYPSYYLEYFEQTAEKLRQCQAAEKTRGEVCMEIEERLFRQFADVNLRHKPPELMERGGALYSTAAISAVNSIYNNKNEPHVISAKNNGAVPFMAADDVVEIRCLLGRGGVTPLPVLNYNDYIINLMKTVKTYEKLTVQAAIQGSRKLALAALQAHPLVGGVIDGERIAAMFDELLDAHEEFLTINKE